jgi:hypothetical protein
MCAFEENNIICVAKHYINLLMKTKSSSARPFAHTSAHETKNLESRNEKSWLSFRSWFREHLCVQRAEQTTTSFS